MAIQNRSSVLAIKEEVTEGTPVEPAAVTDFVILQDGYSVTPETEIIESDELRSSIGDANPTLGIENPTAEISHYLRGSGTQGIAPDFDLLLKAAFGSTSANSTERTTTGGSSVSEVILGAGGSDFARGKAILIKDATNGYRIRPVLSVSSNTLTLGFALPTGTAPATGINVGKCVNYAPANSGHPSLTAWFYRGNAGAVEMLSGARVSEYGIEAEAGQLVNQTFSMEGIKYHFDPISIDAADIKLDFTDSAAAAKVATVTAKTYKDPNDLADALETSMNAAGGADTYTVDYNDTGASAGKFTISSSGTPFTLPWNTGANTANTIGDEIGFSTAADDTGATTYTSDNVQSWAAAYTPSYDSASPIVAKNQEVLFGDITNSACYEVNSVSMTLSDDLSPLTSICQESGVSGKLVQHRGVEISLVGYLAQHDADAFAKYRAGDSVAFCYNFGEKVGGNWTAGKCGSLYSPSARIQEISLGDEDGIITLEMTLKAFVDSSGNGEIYLNFL